MKLNFIHTLLLVCYSSWPSSMAFNRNPLQRPLQYVQHPPSKLLTSQKETGQTIPIQCNHGNYRCADNSKCVQAKDLCNFKKDCNDLSDEQLSLCRKFQRKRGSCTVPSEVDHSSYGCSDISTICSDSYDYGHDDEFQSLCKEIENGLKPYEEFLAMTQEISTLHRKVSALINESSLQDVFELLASSFNESNIRRNDSDCPPLYLNVDGKCLSFFTVAKVTWAEAKHFCESISGKLAILGNLTDYGFLLEHLKSKDLTANFWIGGHYSYSTLQNSSGWKWLDEKDIALRAPYWSLYHAQNCTTIGATRECYTYSLAPRENRDGFCLSLDYAYHYYFIDQNCHEKRSPLCVLDNF